jgi:hypothetical protein
VYDIEKEYDERDVKKLKTPGVRLGNDQERRARRETWCEGGWNEKEMIQWM